jgi:hypothetical protein
MDRTGQVPSHGRLKVSQSSFQFQSIMATASTQLHPAARSDPLFVLAGPREKKKNKKTETKS